MASSRSSGNMTLPFKFSDITNKMGDIIGVGEFSTPVGEMVMHATDEKLPAADWSLNLEVADMIDVREDGAAQAVKAIRRRLKSDSPKSIALALTLSDVCVKNCTAAAHRAFGTREFMADVVELSEGRAGREVQQQALELIQRWGEAFADSPALYFNECYQRQVRVGTQFPPKGEDASPPMFLPSKPIAQQPQPSGGGGGGRSAGAAPVAAMSKQQQVYKLKQDLITVQEKLELCQEMLQHSPGIAEDEILKELIGFLEACKPRLLTLIQLGTAGNLEEDALEACFKLNDALLKTLAAERDGTKIEVDKLDLNLKMDKPDADAGTGASASASLINLESPPQQSHKTAAAPTHKKASFSIADDASDDDEGAVTHSLAPAPRPLQPPQPPPAAAATAPEAAAASGNASTASTQQQQQQQQQQPQPAATTPAPAAAASDLDDFEAFLNERS